MNRTPVREALTGLVREGYASFLSKRGFTCKEIRMQEAAMAIVRDPIQAGNNKVMADLRQRQAIRALRPVEPMN